MIMRYIKRKGIIPLLLIFSILFACGCKDAHTHSLIKVASKLATCEIDGNHEYYICEECQNVFADENGSVPTTLENERIPALGHSFNEAEWGYSQEDGHARVCICGEHDMIFSHVSDGEATEVNAELCIHCGYEIAPMLGHDHSPMLDDGDCTTAILCECNRVMVPGRGSHTFDNECDNSCNNEGCLHKRTTNGHKDDDSNGKCDYCDDDVPKKGVVELPEDSFDE